jgi:hypothetical protein
MRDNHTFLPLPLNVGMAESLIRREFEQGYTYGMLCSKSKGMENVLHVENDVEEFLPEARKWIQQAIDLFNNT